MGLFWFLLGHHLGKRGREEPVYVDKKKCTHTDCVNWHMSIRCTVEHCREHMKEKHFQ